MKEKRPPVRRETTSWEPVGKWYQAIVGEEGHYYHQHVILPALMAHMKIKETKDPLILDLGCGPGVLARQLPPKTKYIGIDLSSTLVRGAKGLDKEPLHEYHLGDITKPLPIKTTECSHATIILALQNVEAPDQAIKNAFKHLRPGGRLFIILNHPCFRVPRQSSWRVDEAQKIQYRRIDRYSSSLKVPMQAHPSKGENSATTWSFHHSLSNYSKWLRDAGFVIELIDEWCSNKVSTGKAAKMENRSREEIPLFLCLIALKPPQPTT